jgi:NTP pyrophosphatase (non-canonical NTP hydrolase)
MELRHYQIESHKTAKTAVDSSADAMIPILGLAGEVGELLNEYKKKLRDGDAHERFGDRVIEELGDILWYVAETATKFGANLEDIAQKNLQKTRSRWTPVDDNSTNVVPHSFDAGFPKEERFPRRFIADFRPWVDGGKEKTRVFVDGVQMGDPLTDNAHSPDGYRFHDVFHLACAAVLGWSPVIRKHLKRKRRSDLKIDEVEDGGRAIVTEEGISALVFAYARDHKSLEGVRSIDYHLLKAIRIMASNFEAAVCTTGEWERAIFQGYNVWKQVEKNQGGKVELDLDNRTIKYLGMI